MSTLFSPVKFGSIQAANRIVMAPLTRNRAPGALPTPLMAAYYAQRADPVNGAGLIVTEATAISHQGQGYSDVPGIWSAEQIKGWRLTTDAVHAAGGKIVVQLWHVGRVSHNQLQPGGQAPVAPSAITAKTKTVLIHDGVPQFFETSAPRALDIAEIPGIVEEYAQAAANAIEAGFDGVEVHGANGYLVDQFLRRGSNHRIDAYGGPIEQRARFLVEVMTAIVQRIGGPRTGIRLSPVTPSNDAADDAPQPLFEYVARQLGQLKDASGAGLAFIHIIQGATGMARDHTQGNAAFDYAAMRRAYEAAGGQAAWINNNSLTKPLAEQALKDGFEAVAFGKLFLANPDLTRRLREDAPLNEGIRATFYGGGEKGYTDYPALADAVVAA